LAESRRNRNHEPREFAFALDCRRLVGGRRVGAQQPAGSLSSQARPQCSFGEAEDQREARTGAAGLTVLVACRLLKCVKIVQICRAFRARMKGDHVMQADLEAAASALSRRETTILPLAA